MSTRRSPALPSPSRRTRDLARRPLTDSDGGAEVRRLNEVIRALMDRVERSTSAQQSAFGAFETTIMLENQVRRRTTELEAALGDNERITRALRESEAKFHALVSQSLVGISLIEDGRIVYTNAKFAEIFGYDEQETQVLQPVNLAALHDRPLVAENIRKRSAGEVDHVSYVFRGVRKDGAEIDVDCHGNAMHIGGRMLLCSLIMDVIELEEKGAANPVVAEGLPGLIGFYTDLCHVQCARASGEVGRISAELVFGYRQHPAWEGATAEGCYREEELVALEGIIPGLGGAATDVVGKDGSHPAKAGPCAQFEGYEQFVRMRARMDGCLTGAQLAKDRAAEALTKVMIPEALDYPA